MTLQANPSFTSLFKKLRSFIISQIYVVLFNLSNFFSFSLWMTIPHELLLEECCLLYNPKDFIISSEFTHLSVLRRLMVKSKKLMVTIQHWMFKKKKNFSWSVLIAPNSYILYVCWFLQRNPCPCLNEEKLLKDL